MVGVHAVVAVVVVVVVVMVLASVESIDAVRLWFWLLWLWLLVVVLSSPLWLLLQLWLQKKTTVSSGKSFVGVMVATFDECLQQRDMLLQWLLQKKTKARVRRLLL